MAGRGDPGRGRGGGGSAVSPAGPRLRSGAPRSRGKLSPARGCGGRVSDEEEGTERIQMLSLGEILSISVCGGGRTPS